ncbi:MAG: hypothetical protein WAQ24_00570 [Candidatus Saccharimonadales bacterium]
MPANNDKAKVLDGVHAGDTPPTPTSRPVLITNRPLMKVDPMLSVDSAESPLENNIVGSSKQAAVTPQARPSVAKTIKVPSLSDTEKEVSTEVSQNENQAPAEAIDHPEEPAKPETTLPDESPKPTPTYSEKSEDTDEADSLIDGTSLSPEKAEPKEPTAEELEIERLIASRKYALPINRVKKRRMLAICLILAMIAAAITLNLLLDLGTIQLGGIPHTHFFTP